MQKAGKLFGESIAKLSVDGLFLLLSFCGLKKAGVRIHKTAIVGNTQNVKIRNKFNASAAKRPASKVQFKEPAQLENFIKQMNIKSELKAKLISELAHDPKNLKRFFNRYGAEVESLIQRNGYPPKYWKSRPSYREGQVETVWENAKKNRKNFYSDKSNIEYIRTEHGTVSWNRDIPRSSQWDMGHLKDQKYSDMYDFFIRGDISREKFLEWYRTAENYEPQTIPFNRGHKGE